MRILVLVVPRLAVQLVRRAHPALRGKPLALMQEAAGVPLVAVPSAEATASGVEPGMTAEEALGRCPGLAMVAARPGEELAELERMAAVLRAKATPRVVVLSREAIGIDLAGLEGRFADERAAGEALLGLARTWLGLDVRGAIADTPGEAAAAARAARQRVAVCEPRGVAGGLPRREGLAVRVAGAVTPERLDAALERLGQVLALHGASCRALEVTAWTGEAGRRWRLRAAGPLHRGPELAALARPLLGALGAAEWVEFRAGDVGPSVDLTPWRRRAAREERAPAPAAPVQRRLALAS